VATKKCITIYFDNCRWDCNAWSKQRHQISSTLSARSGHTGTSGTDNNDDNDMIKKKDLYSDLLACNVSKEAVEKLQHLLGEDVTPAQMIMVAEKQPILEYHTDDGPIYKDVTPTINPPNRINVEEDPVPNKTIDPPSAKDPPTIADADKEKDTKTTSDETRNDTIFSVLTSHTKRQGVSSEHLPTMDEDSVRQELTKLRLQFSIGGGKYRQTLSRQTTDKMPSYASAGGCLARVSEVGSAHINSSSITDKLKQLSS